MISRSNLTSGRSRGSDVLLMLGVAALSYLALAVGDTMLLAPTRSAMAVSPDRVILEWIGSSARSSQFDQSD